MMLRIILCLVALQLSLGLFFMVYKETRRCFILEQPRDTPMVFAYEIMDEGHVIDFSLYYGSMAARELLIMNISLHRSIGHVDFTADNSGFYSLCVQQHPLEGVEYPTRFGLAISYGYDSEHYIKLAKEHDFDVLNIEIHKLNDITAMALNEADYQKHKEATFHQETENINLETIWWPIIQITILLIAGYVQVLHLKTFFKSKKLI